MKILAVDTSGECGTIALASDRDLIEERQLPVQGRRHAQTLVSAVDGLLKGHGIHAGDVDAVAVSVGPGSFTGLRVGVVFAKTFAWANQCDLLAVDTLCTVAQSLGKSHPLVAAISDAQRNEVFLATYEWDEKNRHRRLGSDVRIVPAAEMTATVTQSCIWTGPGLSKFSDELGNAPVAEQIHRNPRAACVAELGFIMLKNGQTANIHTLEPVYIRRSYAEENDERRKSHTS